MDYPLLFLKIGKKASDLSSYFRIAAFDANNRYGMINVVYKVWRVKCTKRALKAG